MDVKINDMSQFGKWKAHSVSKFLNNYYFTKNIRETQQDLYIFYVAPVYFCTALMQTDSCWVKVKPGGQKTDGKRCISNKKTEK